MKKNIFLTGGGQNEELEDFNQLFIKQLKNNGIKNVYYVPFGKKIDLYNKEFQKTSGYFTRKSNIKFTLIKNVEQLVDIDKKINEIALFMAGGNVMRAINTIRGGEYHGIYGKYTEQNQVLWANQNKINIEEYIINFVNGGGFYYGTSSGAILAGKSLNTQMLETANENRENGFNLLNDCSIAPHYEDWQLKFYNSQEEELKTKIIKLKNNDGIVFDNDDYSPTLQYKKQFIERQMEHIRLVQDLAIILEINKSNLPFKVNDWEILNRCMQHDLDKFRKYNAFGYVKIEEYHSNKRNNIDNSHIDKNTLYDCSNRHYETQRHHTQYHNINNEYYDNIDICEMCCDIVATSIRNNDNACGIDYCLNILFPNNQKLDKYKDDIVEILNLLKEKYNRHPA